MRWQIKKRGRGDLFIYLFINLRRKKALGNFKEGVIFFDSHFFAPSDITSEE